MKAMSLLLLVVLAALAETRNHKRRAKREFLERSKRRWVLNTIEVVEEDPGPFPKEISQMFNDKISPKDGTHRFQLSGMGVTEEPMEVFSIDEDTGMVKALKAIDREAYAFFHIKFDILDKKTGQKIDRELAFDIEIKDINDNPPTFSQSKIEEDVRENMPEGYLPGQLVFTDIDQSNTSNSQITISLISQKPLEPKIDVHQIDGRKAQLTFKGCFDYDKVNKYEVIVLAKDHGTPSLSSTATVLLNIVDANSHPPMFKKKEYQAEIQELTTKNDILRFAVEDLDTPKTPGWRAKYFFIKGNEDANYKLETDPETNEGILSIIKGKDYERTTLATLQIGVENEEPLFVCKSFKPSPSATFSDSINATIKVIDVNDPPQFQKDRVIIYRKEEEPPGQELFTPKIFDIDSDVSKIRYVLLKDPANWVAIDKKTGKVTPTKTMDRESPFVDSNNIYQIVIGAIDDGEPPATGTCTIEVHLVDINDNKPRLVNNSVILCNNKVNKVMVLAKDADVDPYSGPFTFSFGEGKSQTEQWKLDPAFGEEAGLISLKSLPYGNYSVPLVIQDQQNTAGHQTLEVTVCDCGEKHVCRYNRKAKWTSLGAAGIGIILLGLLLFLLLLFTFFCKCGKNFNHTPSALDEGVQTLIKYNQEGGGSACKSEPHVLLTNGVAQTHASKQISHTAPAITQEMDMYNNSGFTSLNSLGMQRCRDSIKSHAGQSMYSTWNSNRTNNYQQGTFKYQRTLSLRSQHQLVDQIHRRLNAINENHAGDQSHTYDYEGQGSKCQSLDELSFHNQEDDLRFLNDLGPKFKALGTICVPEMREKYIQL